MSLAAEHRPCTLCGQALCIDAATTICDVHTGDPRYYCEPCWLADSYSPANPFARLNIALDRLVLVASS